MVHAGPVGGGFRVAGVLPYGPQGLDPADSGGTGRPGPGRTVETFVDAGNYFREQSGGALPGDGGAVIDWSGPPHRQREFDNAIGSKKTKGIAIGCGLSVLIVGALGALAFVLLMNWADKGLIEPSVYDSVKVGGAETAVRDKLPEEDSFLTGDLDGKGPAKPKDAECLHLLSTEDVDDQGRDRVFRFCFKGGKLIEKRSYMAKL